MKEESFINSEKKTKKIICYNCQREIDASDLSEGTFFKCKRCFSTLVVADYFRILRERMVRNRDKWGLIGLIISLFPMIILMAIITTYPVLIVVFYLILSSAIILSLAYFKKTAADILFGIVFAEIGVYANITRIILNYYSLPKFAERAPSLGLQVYFFLIAGCFLILFGIRRRRYFVLK